MMCMLMLSVGVSVSWLFGVDEYLRVRRTLELSHSP